MTQELSNECATGERIGDNTGKATGTVSLIVGWIPISLAFGSFGNATSGKWVLRLLRSDGGKAGPECEVVRYDPYTEQWKTRMYYVYSEGNFFPVWFPVPEFPEYIKE